MPRTANAALIATVADPAMVAVDLWTLGDASTYLPGGIKRWTTGTQDVSFGGNTWSASGPVIQHGPVRCTSGIEVSTLDVELQGAFTISGVTLAALAATGAFDDLPVLYERLYLPSFATTPSADYKVLEFYGQAVEIEPSSTSVKITAKSALAKAEQKLPRRVVGPMCPWVWGDADCGIVKSSWQAADTVAAGSTGIAIKLTTGTAYAVPGGIIQFSDGTQRTIAAYDAGTKTVTLDSYLPSTPGTGSAVTIWRGCDKRFETCTSPYANVLRFGGFPFIASVHF